MLAFVLENIDVTRYSYHYRIDGKDFLDPYAYAIEGSKKRVFGMWDTKTQNKLRCGFGQFQEFDWEEDAYPNLPLNEVILYCAHLRGFTRHTSSKVKAKGTFQGLMEKIPYLRELGINQIELMPIYEFKEVIEAEEMMYPQYREDVKMPHRLRFLCGMP